MDDISGQPRLVLGEKVHSGLYVLANAGHQQLLDLGIDLQLKGQSHETESPHATMPSAMLATSNFLTSASTCN
jgi:hypothetical protein